MAALNVLRAANHPTFEAKGAAEYLRDTVDEFVETVPELWEELDWWMRETIDVNPDEGGRRPRASLYERRDGESEEGDRISVKRGEGDGEVWRTCRERHRRPV